MKRVALTLIVLLVATSLFAGGAGCDLKKNAKAVTLTGTLDRSGDAKAVFHVANSAQTYTVCEETKASILELSNSGNLRVSGKVVNCSGKEELVITSAKKI
jgi:predicted small secreted protein